MKKVSLVPEPSQKGFLLKTDGRWLPGQFVPGRVAGDMNEVIVRGNHLNPKAHQLIMQPPDAVFVARNHAGREDHRIAFAQGQVGVVAVGDPGQRRPGFALAAGTDKHHLVVGDMAGALFADEGWNIAKVSVFTRRLVDPPQ